MKGKSGIALDFLCKFHPKGPWVLTSIRPDRKAIETKTFKPSQKAECAKWLEQYNGDRNIYFSVNPTTKPVSKKAEREDIKALAWLHVDIDPRAGEDIKEEQDRALRLLQNPPEGIPKPTCIVFSGGGYQGFWKLKEPVEIDGDLEKAEDAKRYNMHLELTFGADNCHNIDRIMRVPGTVNIPNERKLQKGRTKVLSEIVEFNKLSYSISEFTKAPIVTTEKQNTKVQINGNIQRLDSVEVLDQWGVPDRVRVAIVQGRDSDNPKKGDDSRSAWLFDVCCQLVRFQVPDEIIYSIITDPDFLISESVLELGARAQKYAIRQIERAKEEVEDPWLRKLNEKHAVIRNLGGKCRIIEEQYDPILRRYRLTKQTVLDFMHGYYNVRVEKPVGEKVLKIPLGKYWFEHPMRRQYDSLVFAPGREIPGAYNLWKGFACEAKPGDCSLYLKHMYEVLCQGKEELYDYLIKWMARAVQKPDRPGHVAIVLRGEEGVGKGFFVKQFGSLWGRHFLQVSDPKHLVGSFNAHLRDCSVLFADEAFYAGDKKHESVLKQLITEEMTAIEMKGVDAEASPNYVHLMMSSNDSWVVPAGPTARRFFVLDVSPDHRRDITYFRAIAQQLDNGGREALLHYLMGVNLEGFNVQSAPETLGLRDQKLHSLSPIEEWWYRKLQDGLLKPDDNGWTGEITSEDLVEDYSNYARTFNITRRGNLTLLGKFLKDVCPSSYPHRRRKMSKVKKIVDGGFEIEVNRQRPFFLFPTLKELRDAWVDRYGEMDWDPAPISENRESQEIPF